MLTVGRCEVDVTPDALELTATAETEEDLATVKKIVGGHLDRFGQRNELTVVWARGRGVGAGPRDAPTPRPRRAGGS